MRFLKKYLPNHETIKKSRSFRWLSRWLADPQLWHFNRRSVAIGTAMGLFAAILPLPIQMLLASILAIFFRGNIPVAVVMTWVTNPLTMIPYVYIVYKTGSLITGESAAVPKNFSEFTIDIHHIPELWQQFMIWLSSLGKNFFIGLPIVAIGLALLGYVLVHLIWRLSLYIKIYYRRKRLQEKK